MSGFILHDSDYPKIPELLASCVLGFKESPEYEKVRDDLEIPGVVAAAFANYLVRIQERQVSDPNDAGIAAAISSAQEMIESLASSREPSVRTLVTDEIFESIDPQSEALAVIVQGLKPNALDLYKRWTGEASS